MMARGSRHSAPCLGFRLPVRFFPPHARIAACVRERKKERGAEESQWKADGEEPLENREEFPNNPGVPRLSDSQPHPSCASCKSCKNL